MGVGVEGQLDDEDNGEEEVEALDGVGERAIVDVRGGLQLSRSEHLRLGDADEEVLPGAPAKSGNASSDETSNSPQKSFSDFT